MRTHKSPLVLAFPVWLVLALGACGGQDGQPSGEGGEGGGASGGSGSGGETGDVGGSSAGGSAGIGSGGIPGASVGGNGGSGAGASGVGGSASGGRGGAGSGGVGAMPVGGTAGQNAPGTENLRPCGDIQPDRSHAPFEAIKKLRAGQGPVRILVYGQSISEGTWWSMVRDWLRATYPQGQLVMEEHARGGCAAQCLIGEQPWFSDNKTENRLPGDVYSWNPDLILFHVYGAHLSYQKIVQGFKQNTTAQVLLQTDHRTTDNPQDNGDSRWSQTMSTMHVPAFAKMYGFALARVWEEWFEVMKAENRTAKYFLEDAVHLNDAGNRLMARLIEKHLCYNPAP